MITNKNINKIIISLVVVAVLATSLIMANPKWLANHDASQAPEYADKLFPEDGIVSIEITADPDEWSKMLSNAEEEEYISCDITINGETFQSVGIRPKGNSSLAMVAKDDTTDRFSFKIKMDEYVDGQSYYGLNKFVLNNMQGDATYMKEYLSYDLFKEMGVTTPLYAFADISVNGKLWGFYLAIESEESSFAERNYGEDYGMLYKPEGQDLGGGAAGGMQGGAPPQKRTEQSSGGAIQEMPDKTGQGMPDRTGQGMPDRTGQEMPDKTGHGMPGGDRSTGAAISGGGADLVYTDDDPDSYDQIFDNAVFNADDADEQRVITALKALSTGNDLEKYVDTDEVLRYFAVNTALVNLDSYVGAFKHNYYLYEEDGKISIIPWDLNLSLAGFQSRSAESAVNFPIDTPVSGVELSQRPLIGNLLVKQEYLDQYHEYLNQIALDYFDSGRFNETIEKLDALISEHVKNDPSAFFTYDQYKTAVKTLKAFGALRAQSIQGQLSGSVPATTEDQSSNPDKLIDASSITISDMGTKGNGGGPDKGGSLPERQQPQVDQQQ